MSVMYIRDPDTGEFQPIKALQGEKGETGEVENLTINGVAAESGTITLTASDIGAATEDHTHTAEDVGALPSDGKAADSALLGGKSPEYYIQPRNLLDNSDFTNPVNQRGVSETISTTGYFIDRWQIVSGNVTISSEGLTLNGTISQILEKAPSGTVTAAANAGEAAFDADTNTFSLTGENVLVTWAVLYEGEYTADTLPPYVAPDPVLELAKCKNAYKIIHVTMKPTFMSGTVRVYRLAYGDIRPTLNAPTIEILSADERIVWSSTGATFTVEAVDASAKAALIYASGVTVDDISNCYADIKLACIADL